MKTSVKSIIAGFAGIVLTSSLQAAVITHFDINFDDYPSGALVTAGTAWTKNNAFTTTVEPASGNKHLSVSSSGTDGETKGLVLSSLTNSTTGTQSMKIAGSSSYQWKFSFYLPETIAPVLIRLDNGSPIAGRLIAGMGITNTGQLQYMIDPNVAPLNQQMATVNPATFQLETDKWYHATFDIVTGTQNGKNLDISYNLEILGNENPFLASASYTANAIDSDFSSRVLWGTRSATSPNPLNIRLDDISLRTIPEPGTVSLVIGSALLGFLASRRKAFRRS